MTTPDRMTSELSPAEKRELLIKLLREKARGKSETYPPSHGQRALWYLQQLFPQNAAYNETFAWRIRGKVDDSKLKDVLQELGQRHAILRTTYEMRDGIPVAVIHPTLDVGFECSDANGLDEERLRQLMAEEANRPIDLERGPIIRLRIFRRTDEQIWMTTIHHIAIDLWSMVIVMDELRKLFVLKLLGQPANLPIAPPFHHYAHWQQAFLASEEGQRQRDYWYQQLTDVPPLDFPTDRPHPALQTFRGNTQTFQLDRNTTQRLNLLAKHQRTTLYTVLLSIFQLLLAKYSGQQRFLVGSIASGRTQPAFERTVGFFANPIALLTDLADDPTFLEFLGRTRQTVLGAMTNQDYPFSLLAERLSSGRDLSRPPLVNIAFILQNAQHTIVDSHDQVNFDPFGSNNHSGQRGIRQNVAGLPIEIIMMDQHHAKFDLRLEMLEVDGQLTGMMRYNVALFDPSTIEQLVSCYGNLIETILTDPKQPVSQIPLLRKPEQAKILASWRENAVVQTDENLVHETIRQHSVASPSTVAVKWDAGQWTYHELIWNADKIANHLNLVPAAGGTIAAIYLPRSPEAIASMIACWQSNVASLPLDVSYPEKRLAFMISDAKPAFVITHSEMHCQLQNLLKEADLPLAVAPQVILIDKLEPKTSAYQNLVTENDAAYIVYTSGSTGKPKGVALPHSGMRNLLLSQNRFLGIKPHDRIYQFSNLCFDASIFEIVQTLGTGATLVLPTSQCAMVGTELWQELERNQITVVTLPPSVLATLPTLPLPNLTRLVVAGEACSRELVSRWSVGRRMYNAYGPSEASVCATMYHCNREDRLPAIGQSLTNVRVYVLDEQLSPVPLGVVGEIYIAGSSVGLGYLNRPELTAKKFLPDPFAGNSGDRMYRTGDRGRHRADGAFEFLGRLDHQVKVRGFRIELGEVESTLLENSAVAQAVVLDAPELRDQLVAFVVMRETDSLDIATIIEKCKQTLPNHMVPAQIISVAQIPMTPNGKTDRPKLLDIWRQNHTATTLYQGQARPAFVAPRNNLERQVAAVFAEVLQTSDIGINDSFFDLGGHSLMAAELATKLRGITSETLPLQLVFSRPTVAGIAHALAGHTDAEALDNKNTDFNEDSILDSSIRPSGPFVQSWFESPQQILLTGATGFLGVHLLLDLLRYSTASIHCLVRAESIDAGLHRIVEKLTHHSLLEGLNLARIVPVLGDLAQPNLGLTATQFDDLSRQIEVIYHNGAAVNFVLPYQQLKAANVQGTEAILRLACLGQVKPVHYVSTLSVFPPIDLAGNQIVFEDQPLPDIQWLWDGYGQSKWVAEKLVAEAGVRGVPITIFRPGRITGHSDTGLGEENDLLWSMVRQCIELGTAPTVDAKIDMTPVDFVSRAIFELSTNRDSWGKTYHLVNQHPIQWSILVEYLRDQGYPLRDTSLNHWRQSAEKSSADTRIANLFALLPVGMMPESDERIAVPQTIYDCKNTTTALSASGVQCPAIDDKLLDKYLEHFLPTRMKLVLSEK